MNNSIQSSKKCKKQKAGWEENRTVAMSPYLSVFMNRLTVVEKGRHSEIGLENIQLVCCL